jgi:iron(III) transport system substrate-binding protein
MRRSAAKKKFKLRLLQGGRNMKLKLTLASIIGLGGLFFAAVVPAAAASKTSSWEKTVAAAKAEGRVVIMGPAGADVRDAFTEGFQKKYPGIQVDYNGMAGAQVAPKLLNELSAGVYRTDLIIAGTITAIESLIPANAIVPIQPYLAGPETQDLSKWKGGKFDFSDNSEKFNLVFGNRLQVAFVYNRDMVASGKIKSWKDFLNPEWKGKLAMLNPARAGASQGWVTFWYIKESQGFGKNFVRQLFATQEVVLSNDERQLLDFVARGRYPIAIGPSGTQAFEMKNKGLPVELFGSAALQEGGVISASNGTVMVPRNVPHSNAVKVYLDYLFSREGQHVWSKATGLTSRRRDVANDHIPEVLVPKEGAKYLEDYKEPFVILRDEVVGFVNSVLPR